MCLLGIWMIFLYTNIKNILCRDTGAQLIQTTACILWMLTFLEKSPHILEVTILRAKAYTGMLSRCSLRGHRAAALKTAKGNCISDMLVLSREEWGWASVSVCLGCGVNLYILIDHKKNKNSPPLPNLLILFGSKTHHLCNDCEND